MNRFTGRFLLLLLGGLTAAFLAGRYLLPPAMPFLLGLLLALASEPLAKPLQQRLRLPRVLAAAMGVTALLLLLVLGVVVLLTVLLRQLGALAGVLPELTQAVTQGLATLQGALLGLCRAAPDALEPTLTALVTGLFSGGSALLERAASALLGLAANILGKVPNGALGFFTTLLSAFLFSAKLPALKQWLSQKIPPDRIQPLRDQLAGVRQTVSGWLKAQLRLMGVTFTILCLGFALLRIRHGYLWAILVAVIDAIPLLGTGSVLLPWAVLCLLRGETVQAVGLVGLFATAALTRSVLEPKLLGKHLGLDPLMALIALYLGLRLWGVWGMVLAPMAAVTVRQLLRGRKPAGQ